MHSFNSFSSSPAILLCSRLSRHYQLHESNRRYPEHLAMCVLSTVPGSVKFRMEQEYGSSLSSSGMGHPCLPTINLTPTLEISTKTPLSCVHLFLACVCVSVCALLGNKISKACPSIHPPVAMVTEGCLKAITPYLCLDRWMRRRWTKRKNDRENSSGLWSGEDKRVDGEVSY